MMADQMLKQKSLYTGLRLWMSGVVFGSLICMASSCSVSKSPQEIITQKFPAAALQQDVILLRKILEANHPGLYTYTSKDSMDAYFNATLQSITDSLTGYQFKNKLAWLVSHIRCGHTSVAGSKAYLEAAQQIKQRQFPLLIKAWKDSLVVINNLRRQDSIFKRGTIITSINGLNNTQLLDSMFRFISTDGYNDNFKDQVSSFNFPAYYKNAFGLTDSFTIGYIDTSGKNTNAVIPVFNPLADTISRTNTRVAGTVPPKPSRKQLKELKKQARRNLSIDNATSTAYMQLNTFSGSGLRSFFRHSFKQLKDSGTKNLVIDLRLNGGGSINISTLLAKYISDHPFTIADTIAAKTKSLPYSRYIHPSFIYWLSMQFFARKKEDGLYHFSYYEKHKYQPKTTNHFDGNVYFIQGGYTFSASCLLLSVVKGQHNITLAGEETGGGGYSNNAVHLPTIRLPNTGVQVVLPLYRMVLHNTGAAQGRGIAPDILIEPTSAAIQKGVDIKMDRVKEIIQSRRKVI